MIASSKCRSLAIALQSLITQVRFEDVEIAANHILQCATNVLSVREIYLCLLIDLIILFLKAVNMPLQKRGMVLDLDVARSNIVAEYDDNIDLLWNRADMGNGSLCVLIINILLS